MEGVAPVPDGAGVVFRCSNAMTGRIKSNPMFEQINFEITQLQFLETAMGQPALSGFKPDNKTLVQVTALRTGAEASKVTLAEKLSAWQSTRGGTGGDCTECREIAVAVYGSMRSVYRNVSVAPTQFKRIPKSNSSTQGVLDRMTLTAAVWGELPNPPGTSTPFQLGALTLAGFEALVAGFQEKVSAEVAAKGAYLSAQKLLSELTVSLRSFIGAAIAQGKALYPEGTEARAWIDAIPTEANTPAPSQAVISSATSPTNGAVRLEFTSAHATSFTVWHKGPGASVFTQVGESELPGVYEVTGLAAGDHVYEIVGRNSRGDGVASAPATVAVAGVIPAQPWISGESTEPGVVHLWYGAEGATSFQVWHKGPGESVFAQVDTTVSGEYATSGLVAGMHAYKVVGVNAAGVGPSSEPTAIDVAAEAVA